MSIVIDLNIDNCVGCGACTIACMDENNLDATQNCFRTVTTIEEVNNGKVKLKSISVACMHCEDAPCIVACPAGCISKDATTNLTVVDNTNCIGCHSCAMACPFGAPNFDMNGKMIKCDGCNDRIIKGVDPACVRVCPFEALVCYDSSQYQQQKINSLRAKLAG